MSKRRGIICFVMLTSTLIGLQKVSALKTMTTGPFEGYVLSIDRINNFHPMYMGCYVQNKMVDGFPHTANLQSVSIVKCIYYCREHGFTFAGLRAGTDCLCGHAFYSKHSPSCVDHSVQRCNGETADACGGRGGATDVYRVCDYQQYGVDTEPYQCENECPLCNNGCYLNGTCLEGCGPGQKPSSDGSSCSRGCENDDYGIGCQFERTECNTGAHPLNGYCIEGCDTRGGSVHPTGIFCVFTPTNALIEGPNGACPLCENCINPVCYGNDNSYYYHCPITFTGEQVCHACYNFWWDDWCTKRCNEPRCRECEKNNGTICLSCTPAYWYMDCSRDCDPKCHIEGCHMNNGTCVVCEDGGYGAYCEHDCGHCSTGRCERFTGECIRCDGNCVHTCLDGYIVTDCKSACSPHCGGEGDCNEESAICNAGCVVGYYLPLCNASCPIGCVSECERYIGVCSACIDGRYGTQQCEELCSINCLTTACDRATGDCLEGCRQGAIGSKCDACEGGLYGVRCDESCSEHCSGNDFCEQDIGNCKDGCQDGFWGGPCVTSCGHCAAGACLREDGTCSPCEAGYYSIRCNVPCPTSCKDTCDRTDGTCASCIEGFYGDTCAVACPANCNLTLCHRATGICTNGCVEGYSGSKCNDTQLLEDTDLKNERDLDKIEVSNGAIGAVVAGLSMIVLLGSVTKTILYFIKRKQLSKVQSYQIASAEAL